MHIPLRLIWKLLLINSTSLLIMLILVIVAVHWLSSSYFMTLMVEYRIDTSQVHQMFLKAVDRYLVIASLSGFAIATLLSLWLNYRLMRPLSELMHSATRISEGDFSKRVNVKGCGEIDQLSLVFNSMANNLQRLEKLKRDFVVDVAHELRTPLTNIRGYLEGLRDNVISANVEVFDSLHEETLRLVRLVEELLQLARADLAKSNLQIQCFDLSELTRQTLRAFAPRFAEKSLQITQTLPAIMIHADKERLTQVLTNLFENALRYSPTNGAVSVLLNVEGHQVRLLMVNDCEQPQSSTTDAVGLETLFERFQRGDVSRSRDLGGAGLGLAIVKELIDAHRGKVGYRIANGRAEFWFELPIRR